MDFKINEVFFYIKKGIKFDMWLVI